MKTPRCPAGGMAHLLGKAEEGPRGPALGGGQGSDHHAALPPPPVLLSLLLSQSPLPHQILLNAGIY